MTKAWLLCALFACCLCSHAQPVLEKVLDGDTVVIRDQAQSYHLRLLDIDAPELHQAFGKQSRRSLSQLCMNTAIAVHTQGNDMYGRTWGICTVATPMPANHKLRSAWPGLTHAIQNVWHWMRYNSRRSNKAWACGRTPSLCHPGNGENFTVNIIVGNNDTCRQYPLEYCFIKEL